MHGINGGYVLAGYTNEPPGTGGNGGVLELNAAGSIVWAKAYDTGHNEAFMAIDQTPDGYVVAGVRRVWGQLWPMDFWVARIDAQGNLLDAGGIPWSFAYGSIRGNEIARDVAYVRNVPDLGDVIVVVGETTSYGGGGKDFWVIVLDPATGRIMNDPSNTYSLQIAIGGVYDDIARALLPLDPLRDQWIVAGETRSFSTNPGVSSDMWVLQLTHLLTNVWEFTYGGPGDESAHTLVRLWDDIIVGGDETSFHPPGTDMNMWLLRINTLGGILWQKSYGYTTNRPGRWDEQATTLELLAPWPARLLAGGWTTSVDGTEDIWLLNLDPATGDLGPTGWQGRYYLDDEDERTYTVLHDLYDGIFVSADTTGGQNGDWWALKLDYNGDVIPGSSNHHCVLTRTYWDPIPTDQDPTYWEVAGEETDAERIELETVVFDVGFGPTVLCPTTPMPGATSTTTGGRCEEPPR